MERERTIELLLGMIFLVLVFLMIVICLGLGSSNSKSTTTNTITNIMNSYNTLQNPSVAPAKTVRHVEIARSSPLEPKKTYLWDDWNTKTNKKYYESSSKHLKEYRGGYYTDTFRVYLQNNGPSDYFTVRFYFEDYDGHIKTYDLRKYVYHNDEELFYFRDISKNKYEYYKWHYKILY